MPFATPETVEQEQGWTVATKENCRSHRPQQQQQQPRASLPFRAQGHSSGQNTSNYGSGSQIKRRNEWRIEFKTSTAQTGIPAVHDKTYPGVTIKSSDNVIAHVDTQVQNYPHLINKINQYRQHIDNEMLRMKNEGKDQRLQDISLVIIHEYPHKGGRPDDPFPDEEWHVTVELLRRSDRNPNLWMKKLLIFSTESVDHELSFKTQRDKGEYATTYKWGTKIREELKITTRHHLHINEPTDIPEEIWKR
ncbi:hypothetical protein CC1G_10962 [Coprinopsis cinerea okayama7|uniref:Uncharacterized protein n=1 Tax=Coprinopsis cinerea (strain Okayama-7 / 130 / ATCC MYA-4618 / FGSC 9003) TaxID=240176 RepID=A8PC01_COPC7|nr:hypothetical protein CC1G_10962 [Coprinopsis cinerea okayama7\|eukprot:XP_001840299.2 hypothetical protein CC1G_10962 [Coprinopsis cinerea okayama7\